MENTENNGNMNKSGMTLSLPLAIVVAGVLIAGAILITKAPAPSPANNAGGNQGDLKKLAPVSEVDHIFGASPANKVFIIEFSDTECPFCKRFHPTMKKIVENYNGQVAWVYRHFPLAFHTKAKREAEATECAAELGSNDAFWKYLDQLFEITPGNDGLDPTELYNIAAYTGLDSVAFKNCLDSGKYTSKVEADMKQGAEVGVSGTPSSFLVYKKKIVAIEGAQSYEAVKAEIDKLLK